MIRAGVSRAAVLLSVVLAAGSMPGCIIVSVDDDGGSRWERSKTHRIGVSLADVPGSTASQLGVERSRVCLISDVEGGSPADRAGLRKYDVVTRIDGRDGADDDDLRDAIRSKNAGETLTLTVMRGGKTVDVVVVPEVK
jgi:S1-C subfamily serine protease